jgi:hypothetical protein
MSVYLRIIIPFGNSAALRATPISSSLTTDEKSPISPANYEGTISVTFTAVTSGSPGLVAPTLNLLTAANVLLI